MGAIDVVTKTGTVPIPPFNRRFVVELCENVHLHYRNLRLEFPKEEFLRVLDALQQIDRAAVENFEFGKDEYQELIKTTLPVESEFNDRLVVERQQGGMFHLHYRNLRVELDHPNDIGIKT